jgi:hypothetical protein
MLSLRYHITSLVAIFAALAVGIALGGGPLQRDGGKTTRDLVKAREQLAAARTTATAGQANSAFVDRYVLGTAGPLVGGSLAKRSVAVVELPGADSAAVAGVTDLVSQAGGTVTGTLKLANKVDQAGNRQLVDALTTQMVAQAKDISLPASQPTYARLGYLVGRALGSTTPTAAYDDTAVSLVAGLDTAGLASTSGQPTGRSGLVLVVGHRRPRHRARHRRRAEGLHRRRRPGHADAAEGRLDAADGPGGQRARQDRDDGGPGRLVGRTGRHRTGAGRARRRPPRFLRRDRRDRHRSRTSVSTPSRRRASGRVC